MSSDSASESSSQYSASTGICIVFVDRFFNLFSWFMLSQTKLPGTSGSSVTSVGEYNFTNTIVARFHKALDISIVSALFATKTTSVWLAWPIQIVQLLQVSLLLSPGLLAYAML